MKKFWLLFLLIAAMHTVVKGQGKLDSLFASRDSTAVLDSLMRDFDKFLDSMSAPHSFLAVSVGVGTGFFSFQEKNTVYYSTKQRLLFSPTIGYFHKSGLGLSAYGTVIGDNSGLNIFQYAISPSYDLINRNFSTGVSFTKYFTKDSLDFYTTPIQNEIFAYFSYKKWWLRPTISFTYGWGSNEDYQKREFARLRKLLLLRRRLLSVVRRNTESVEDFSVGFSLRKDFNWYDVLGKEDIITFTPVLLLNGGTQRYGFNTAYSYNFAKIRINSQPSNQQISEQSNFEVLSAGLVLRGSYLRKRWLIQPQVLFDYYLPDGTDKFHTVFSVMAGLTL